MMFQLPGTILLSPYLTCLFRRIWQSYYCLRMKPSLPLESWMLFCLGSQPVSWLFFLLCSAGSSSSPWFFSWDCPSILSFFPALPTIPLLWTLGDSIYPKTPCVCSSLLIYISAFSFPSFLTISSYMLIGSPSSICPTWTLSFSLLQTVFPQSSPS